MSYYVSRPFNGKIEYEENYWVAKDPDGKCRHKKKERSLALEDIKDELKIIRACDERNIVDIGCGFGFLLSALGNDWKKFGVEISKMAAREARKHAIVVNSTKWLATGMFDVVTMHHVIEHLEEPLEMLEEVNRLLVCGGILSIVTPNFDSPCARLFGDNYRMLHDKSHISLFSDKGLIDALMHTGFKVFNVEYPYFNTRHYTKDNLLRMLDTTKVSPPFYGNIVSVYARKL